MKILVQGIRWNVEDEDGFIRTDAHGPLPLEMQVEISEDATDIAAAVLDALSDKTGWLVDSYLRHEIVS